jgi:hypothetical protein
MSKHPVNAGSTREELWHKVLKQKEQIAEVHAAHKQADVQCQHAVDRCLEMKRKLVAVRRLLNSD